jgi:hypothetical protein
MIFLALQGQEILVATITGLLSLMTSLVYFSSHPVDLHETVWTRKSHYCLLSLLQGVDGMRSDFVLTSDSFTKL